jgi:hypothetical protein
MLQGEGGREREPYQLHAADGLQGGGGDACESHAAAAVHLLGFILGLYSALHTHELQRSSHLNSNWHNDRDDVADLGGCGGHSAVDETVVLTEGHAGLEAEVGVYVVMVVVRWWCML